MITYRSKIIKYIAFVAVVFMFYDKISDLIDSSPVYELTESEAEKTPVIIGDEKSGSEYTFPQKIAHFFLKKKIEQVKTKLSKSKKLNNRDFSQSFEKRINSYSKVQLEYKYDNMSTKRIWLNMEDNTEIPIIGTEKIPIRSHLIGLKKNNTIVIEVPIKLDTKANGFSTKKDLRRNRLEIKINEIL